jgi:hypothetical protein
MNARSIQIPGVLTVTAAAVALVGCGSTGGDGSTSSSSGEVAKANLVSTKRPWSPPTIDPANFVSRVDNPFLPLVPGTTLRYRGAMKDGTTPQVDTFAVTIA